MSFKTVRQKRLPAPLIWGGLFIYGEEMGEKSGHNLIGIIVALCITGFLFGCESAELNRLRQTEKEYKEVVIERSKKITKKIYEYKHTRTTYSATWGAKPETNTYIVHDAGIKKLRNFNRNLYSDFYWFGDVRKVDRCYIGEQDFCICTEGRKDFNLCFHKGIRRDNFYRAFTGALSRFKKKYKSLYR